MPYHLIPDEKFVQVIKQGENHGDHNPPAITVSVGKITYAISELKKEDCLIAYGIKDDGEGHIEMKEFEIFEILDKARTDEAKVKSNLAPKALRVFYELAQAMCAFNDNPDMLEAAERDIAERKGYNYPIERKPKP